ncbi:MAG: glycogen/starch synthase [candidate division WWE3 bacterium]|nr:glycogen/starch synthase [candidate division WWE3 bacterium]
MKVLLAASECAPFIKVGGLGDVIGALPKALLSLGVEVAVVIPLYKSLVDTVTTKREEFSVRFNNKEESVTVYVSKIPESQVPIFFLQNETYLSNGGVYFDKSAFASSQEEISRFAFFSKAVAQFCDSLQPDLVHCNDWHTALIPYFLKDKHVPTILTIHNLANQGFSSLDINKSLDLITNRDRLLDWDEADSNLDLLLQGVTRCTLVTTVSENYAREITTQEFGEGLDDVLRARAGRLVGILNGIDTDTYDPKTDPNISTHYDSELFVSGKLANKIALQKELGLNPDPTKLVIGLIGRLTHQKGIDLVLGSLNEVLRNNAQLIILGSGEESLEEKLKSENDRFGQNSDFKAVLGFDEGLARRIYAGSDLFLVPSRFEPCGLTQMIAMRYGSLPVVRDVGGLHDSVKDGIDGFVFKDFSPKSLGEAINRTAKTFGNPYSWKKMVCNAMAYDWSWARSAEKYVEVYKKVVILEKTNNQIRHSGQDLESSKADFDNKQQTTNNNRAGLLDSGSGAGMTSKAGGLFRFDKTKELWTVIAPSRKSRPVSVGSTVKVDPFAYGNEALTPPEVFRIGGGEINKEGWQVRVTPNKYPITDYHEVIIHNPDGTRDWADYTVPEALNVLAAYKQRFEYYAAEREDFYPHLYCNHGAAAGASLSHPHSQLVIFNRLPETIAEEVTQSDSYYAERGECVYCRLIENDNVFTERLIYEDKYIIVVTPFASAWPYELMILPKRHQSDFTEIRKEEMAALAASLIKVTAVIKKGFSDAAYNFWIHSLPKYGLYSSHQKSYHWHLELVPRLKVLAGIELGAGVMVDDKASPEEAAKFYRENL